VYGCKSMRMISVASFASWMHFVEMQCVGAILNAGERFRDIFARGSREISFEKPLHLSMLCLKGH